MKRLAVATVVTLALLAGMACAEDEKTETTYKVGLDAESIGEVAKVLEQYVDGPLAIYYEGAVKVKFAQPLIAAVGLVIGIVVFAWGLKIGIKCEWDPPNEPLFVPIIVIGAVGVIVGGIAFLSFCPQLVSPEYYAIRDIIRSLR